METSLAKLAATTILFLTRGTRGQASLARDFLFLKDAVRQQKKRKVNDGPCPASLKAFLRPVLSHLLRIFWHSAPPP